MFGKLSRSTEAWGGSIFEFATQKKRVFRDAAQNGDLEKLKGVFAKENDIESRSDYGATALHKAAAAGHAHCVEWLLENGADPTVVHKGGKTPLQQAQDGNYTAVVALLGPTEGPQAPTGVHKQNMQVHLRIVNCSWSQPRNALL
jgi:hypothetical protein